MPAVIEPFKVSTFIKRHLWFHRFNSCKFGASENWKRFKEMSGRILIIIIQQQVRIKTKIFSRVLLPETNRFYFNELSVPSNGNH